MPSTTSSSVSSDLASSTVMTPSLRARGGRPALLGRYAQAVRGVLAVAQSGQDPPDRVRPLCGGTTSSSRARKTGDLQLSWLYLHLCTQQSWAGSSLYKEQHGAIACGQR